MCRWFVLCHVLICTVSVLCAGLYCVCGVLGMYCVMRDVMGHAACDGSCGCWALGAADFGHCLLPQRLMQQYAEIEKQIQRGR
jgi:hypothetical protein